MRGSPFTLVALLAGAILAGCIGSSDEDDLGSTGNEADSPWEGDLATVAETPDIAPRRSDAERRSDVAPPGAPQFAAFDAVMEEFMTSHQVPAASVAVLRDGKLRYENGYGFLDEAGTNATPPDAMFRIASITKPMTAAVIAMLVEQGRVAYDDPVFCLPPEPAPNCRLDIPPHPKRPVGDERLADLEVRHLVDHQAGWTRGPCTDPYFPPENVIGIAEEFVIPSPPPSWRLVQWMMGTPMEFDPGTDPNADPVTVLARGELDTYCNVGYGMLGLIAEAATGTTMAALYGAYIFDPLEVTGEIEPGHSLPEMRNPREPTYACDGGKVPNVYDPDEEVCWADGGFDLDGALSLGGLISTAAATGSVFEVFRNEGSVRDEPGLTISGHSGGLPGTATTAWRVNDGQGALGDLQIVVFFNKATGHELVPFQLGAPYEYQLLYANLLGAFTAAETTLPALPVG